MKTQLNLISLILLIALITNIYSCSEQKSNKYPPFSADLDQKLEWWKDARFGMFIHWGPVSLKGTEIGWSRGGKIPVEEYDSLYLQFNPVNFDAAEWVKLAKDAGMKYMVLVTKHHDGFCLWDTKQTDYNIMNTPFRRDVVRELSDACKKAGIAFGTYYSSCDWYHPAFPLGSPGGKTKKPNPDLEAYDDYLRKQTSELITNYGPLLTMWFDIPQSYSEEYGIPMVSMLRELQPDILINNRAYSEPERTGGISNQKTVGDYDTPEQRIGNFQIDRPWETCMTIARQWAWKPNDEVKSLEQCLHSLIRTAGGDGNLLFNIGPKPDGTIEPLQAQRLREMGQWLEKYGHTIYGTRGGPFKPTDWGVSTRKENKIYLHILKWQGENPQIRIPALGMEIKACQLANGEEVTLKKQGSGYLVQFPGENLEPINIIVELTVDGNAMDISPGEIPAQSLSFNKPVTASTNPYPHWRDAGSVNNGDWVGHYWKPANNDQTPWVEIDLGKTEEISKVILFESGQAITAFEIQCLKDDVWETAYSGNSVKNGMPIDLNGITAQKVRLVLNEFSSVPGIHEFIIL